EKHRLSHLRTSPNSFSAAPRGGSTTTSREGGGKVSYLDTRAAATTFTVLRVEHGHDVRVGSFVRHDHSGANGFRFSGRVGGKALGTGSYVLRAVAKLRGLVSNTVGAPFTIRAGCDPDHDGDCDTRGAH